MDVFSQRLEQEYDAEVVVTSPSVPFKIIPKVNLTRDILTCLESIKLDQSFSDPSKTYPRSSRFFVAEVNLKTDMYGLKTPCFKLT